MSKRSSIMAGLGLAFIGTGQAATLTVTNTSDGPAPGPAGSLRRAINDAGSGDTISFALPANSTITLTGAELLIAKHLTISGPGANLLSVTPTQVFGIFVINGNFNVTISGLTIANGSASDSGGGIFNVDATLTITGCTISGNSAAEGGGIDNAGGTVTITNSTISANDAINGGGISNSGGTVAITNSTISANNAINGGGIDNAGGTVTITNSTISANYAGNGGGGIFSVGGTLTARNAIIASNTAVDVGPDVQGALTSQGYNLIGNTSETIITGTTTGNQLNVDPKLGPLQDNGGPTLTHALLSGSPARDKGHSSGSLADQRGFTRPVGIPGASGGDGSDIGAFEVGGTAVPLKIISITRSGNGPVVLQVAGVPNGLHRIQASADLSAVGFIDIGTVTADAAGLFQYQEAVTGLARFYRVAFP